VTTWIAAPGSGEARIAPHPFLGSNARSGTMSEDDVLQNVARARRQLGVR